MARRIRRRPGVIWLPLSNENRLTLNNPIVPGSTCLGQYLIPDTGANPGDATTAVFPVVNDQPQLTTTLTSSLADTEGSAYRLRRIVGKIFVEYDMQAAAGGPFTCEAFLVTIGFIILEVEPSLAFLPKSATQTDYSTVAMSNVRDPWIWRRSWIVGNSSIGTTAVAGGAVATTLGGAFSPAPNNNFAVYGGGVLDGPHIDAKTARVVRDDQRLSMVISIVRQSTTSPVGANPANIVVTTDLRVLGSLRKQSGNRHNASR